MKKQIISESKLREIIKEEALRMKKRITLENEKKTLLKKLNEMYMEDNAPDGNTDDGECDGSMAGAMGEGQEMEEGFADLFKGTDWAAEADKRLGLPAYKQAAKDEVSKMVRAGAEAVGEWAKHFFEGKDITDNAQANEVFRNMLGTYKNLWKNNFVTNKGNVANMQFNPMTGTFEAGDSGTGLGFGFGTQHEGKKTIKKKI